MSRVTGQETLPILAGVELGGTKAIAVVAQGRAVLDEMRVPTTSPDETLGALSTRLTDWSARFRPQALGIASFGPVSLRLGRPDYGQILPTTKPGWAGADIVTPLATPIDGPRLLQTDVNAAALAEGRWGAGRGMTDFIYVTIGTGVGMGIIVNGLPVTGQMHPEAGHIRVRRMSGDIFPGACTFHGDCLEGLASGPAIAARAGRPAHELTPDDPAWALVADAIAEAFVALILTLAPQLIIVGGGVGVGQPHLLARVREGVAEKIAGYLPFIDRAMLDRMIVPPMLADRAGPLGALLLAEMALDGVHRESGAPQHRDYRE